MPLPAASAPSRRRRRWRPGSAGRLAVLHATVLLFVFGIVVLVTVRNFTVSYRTVADRGLVAELRSFRDAAQTRPAGEDLLRFTASYLHAHALPAGDVIAVSVPDHGTVGSPGAGQLLAAAPVRPLLAAPLVHSTLRSARVADRPVRILAAPVQAGTQRAGTFLATADLSAFAAERSRVLVLSLIGSAAALVVAVASAFFLLRRLLRTVGGITAAADEIGRGDLHRRLAQQGTDDEVGQLARSLNTMLERLDTAVTAQQRLLADVSHQLRTPLTVARGHLEVLDRTELTAHPDARETVATVIDELEHMRTLVDRLLSLGHAMEVDPLAREPVDLRSFLVDLFEASRVMADRDWQLAPVPDVVIEVEPAKLRGALLNLIDNAIHATNPGDHIGVAAECRTDAHQLLLSVADSGPGIPPDQREAVLARFARPGARDGGGSGLGLAIVKAVAEAHGGTLLIDDAAAGGARLTMVLPLVEA